ncbi:MAG: hypothetical protein IKN96_03440 [Oscillibacter sp.]|nr:hypothetical protein [Oscillibacter sp.]
MNEQQTVPASPAPDDAPPVASPAPDAPANPVDAAPANPVDAAPAAVEPDYRAMCESLRRENEILRHNAQIAQSAPVRSVTGGGSAAEPADDFLRGFDSDAW